MTETFVAGKLFPMYRDSQAAAVDLNTDATIHVGSRLSPFKDVLHDQLHAIREAA